MQQIVLYQPGVGTGDLTPVQHAVSGRSFHLTRETEVLTANQVGWALVSLKILERLIRSSRITIPEGTRFFFSDSLEAHILLDPWPD